MTSTTRGSRHRVSTALLISVLGVVYGDIGTSPLYALRECFGGAHAIPLTADNILSVLSLIFWSLILVISIKYVLFIFRADNNGEGGILAILALAGSAPKVRSTVHSKWIVSLGLFGAALLYGDGVITPAISVLSAVEGLKLVTPTFNNYVVHITAVILLGLFAVQSQGTARIGRVFGIVMLVWFSALAVMGIVGIFYAPEVLKALNPLYALHFISSGWSAFVVLSSVFLVVTGGEALYADMGHFGRAPIKIAWFCLVLPALVLNYFGQGALLISDPESIENPFYRLAPTSLTIPLVILATAATIIASQAMISGVFSITRQATQLGFLPRTKIVHTSEEEIGQIYLPKINWFMLVATLFLVYHFRSSSNLANAYGIAVSLDMVITTLLAAVVVHYVWRWKPWQSLSVVLSLLVIDLSFLIANFSKVFHGGSFPLLIGVAGCLLMISWRRGRAILSEKLFQSQRPLREFVQTVGEEEVPRVEGTGVFLSANLGATPPALVHTLKHNKTLLSRIVIMTIVTEGIPHVGSAERIIIDELGEGFYTVTARLGFMEGPNVPRLLRAVAKLVPELDLSQVTYYLGRETLIHGRNSALPTWQAQLFMLLSRNAESAMSFFRLPSDRVIEVGIQVQI